MIRKIRDMNKLIIILMEFILRVFSYIDIIILKFPCKENFHMTLHFPLWAITSNEYVINIQEITNIKLNSYNCVCIIKNSSIHLSLETARYTSKFPVGQVEYCWIILKALLNLIKWETSPAKYFPTTAIYINVMYKMLVKGENKNKQF